MPYREKAAIRYNIMYWVAAFLYQYTFYAFLYIEPSN